MNNISKNQTLEKPCTARDYILYFIAFIIVLSRIFLWDLTTVHGQSMLPTLNNNDKLIVTTFNYSPQQGDIVVLDANYQKRCDYFTDQALAEGKSDYSDIQKLGEYFTLPQNLKKHYYIKRIIALPNQLVDLKNGTVYVDGIPLDESYCSSPTLPTDLSVQFPLTVAENSVFVMGDNRQNSTDSRSSMLGLVPYDAILGKAVYRVFPFDAIQAFN